MLSGLLSIFLEEGFPDGSVVKNPPANAGGAGDRDFIPGWGRSPGAGNGKLLQYSRRGHPMDRGAWRATVHAVTESDRPEQLKQQVGEGAGGLLAGAEIHFSTMTSLRF